MKILFVCGAYTESISAEIIKYSKSHSIQNAPNVFQWAVIDGLYKNQADFSVLSFPFVSSYPIRYTKGVLPFSEIKYNNECVGESISYSTFIGLKDISIRHNVLREIEKWAHKYNSSEELWVITYTPFSFFTEPVVELKSKFANLYLCCIVTDLIQDAGNFSVNRNFFKRLQNRIEYKKQLKIYPYIDKYILLSKHMEEYIPESAGRNIVVEGISKDIQITKSIEPGSTNRTLLYTGSLHEFSGIKVLVDAFGKTSNPNFRLQICGIGECANYVCEKAKVDSRIIFLGNVPRDEAVNRQRLATVLINPRQPNGEITKYSFPSKTMEYLSSGRPMIGYRLEGIPSEYYNYYYTVDDNSIESLSEKITEVLTLQDEELRNKADAASRFIRGNKTSYHQVNKIISFLERHD